MTSLRTQLEGAMTRALERANRTLSPRTMRLLSGAITDCVTPMLAKTVAERDQARMAQHEALAMLAEAEAQRARPAEPMMIPREMLDPIPAHPLAVRREAEERAFNEALYARATRPAPATQPEPPAEPRCARCGCTSREHHKLHCEGHNGNCVCHGGWLDPGQPLTGLDHVGQDENADWDGQQAKVHGIKP